MISTERRAFCRHLATAGLLAIAPGVAVAGGADYRRLLVLVELKGGNDGLNTVVPYADPLYASLRPRLGLRREEVLQLDGVMALHPALKPLMALWQAGELAVVGSVGYPKANLSHFRSIEIWDTASAATAYLPEGWLGRLFARHPAPREFMADGVLAGSSDLGPLTGARAIALADPDQFRRQARLAQNMAPEGNGALRHVLQVEGDITQAASRLAGQPELRAEFPKGAFGDAVRTGCRAVASGGIAVLRLTLNGFDTHQNQPGTQANLLGQLAEGLAALKAALTELGRWQDTLVMSYSEFGRRPRENQSNGTDHGTAAPHFVLGGQVRGGIYGAAPALDRLDGNGNLSFAVDFRSLYATAIEDWWGFSSQEILGGRFQRLPLLRRV